MNGVSRIIGGGAGTATGANNFVGNSANRLNRDIVVAGGDAILIQASQVDLDLNGYAIKSTGDGVLISIACWIVLFAESKAIEKPMLSA